MDWSKIFFDRLIKHQFWQTGQSSVLTDRSKIFLFQASSLPLAGSPHRLDKIKYNFCFLNSKTTKDLIFFFQVSSLKPFALSSNLRCGPFPTLPGGRCQVPDARWHVPGARNQVPSAPFQPWQKTPFPPLPGLPYSMRSVRNLDLKSSYLAVGWSSCAVLSVSCQ